MRLLLANESTPRDELIGMGLAGLPTRKRIWKILPGKIYTTTMHQCSVDVDFTHVVDDDGNTHTVAVAQHMVQQRGFPAPKNPDNTVTGKRCGMSCSSSFILVASANGKTQNRHCSLASTWSASRSLLAVPSRSRTPRECSSASA